MRNYQQDHSRDPAAPRGDHVRHLRGARMVGGQRPGGQVVAGPGGSGHPQRLLQGRVFSCGQETVDLPLIQMKLPVLSVIAAM